MADNEYFGSAQFQPIAQQREHEDRYVKEIIMMGGKLDIDYADFMREDIMTGNTATLRRFNKANKLANFQMQVVDGTTDPRLPVTKAINQDWYPMIPIKDDASGPGGYAAKPANDPRRRDVEKALRYLDIDLEDISKQVLDPEPIPDVGTTQWKKSYGRQWKDSPSLREEHGSEQAWHDQMVEDQGEQKKSIKDLTDIHVGLYATAGTLDEANIIAVYAEYAKLLPQLSFRGFRDRKIPDYPPQTYIYQASSGYNHTISGLRGWTHIIRRGIVKNRFDKGKVESYNKKSNVNFYYGRDTKKPDSAGDPISRVIRSDPQWQAQMNGSRPIDLYQTMIELQVQLTRGANPTYGEIRMWNFECAHIVTNDNDGKITLIKGGLGGKIDGTDEGPDVGDRHQTATVANGSTEVGRFGPNSVDISWSLSQSYDAAFFNLSNFGGHLTFKAPASPGRYFVVMLAAQDDQYITTSLIHLEVVVLNADGTQPPARDAPWKDSDANQPAHEPGDDEYNDLCLFYIGREATHEVPVFKRERLVRETVQLGIYAVKIVKLKWYQKRWFSIVIFIVGLALAYFTGGQSLAYAIKTMIVTTVFGLAVQVIIKMVSMLIDNPFLVAALLVVAGVITGYINLSDIMRTVQIAMDITTTAIKEITARRLKEIQEKAKEFSEMAHDLQEEMDQLMEEAGLLRLDAWEYLKQMLVVPDAEMPSHSLERATDVGVSLQTGLVSMTDVESLWDSMITQQ